MLKKNDLRIGNLIEYNGITFTIKEVRHYYISADRGKGMVDINYDEIKPISLTEEWLLKLGFVKLNHLGMFVYVLYIDEWINFEVDLKHETFHLVSGQENNDLNIDIGSYTVYRLIDIKHVHQLQNLYFALTGCELEINLNNK